MEQRKITVVSLLCYMCILFMSCISLAVGTDEFLYTRGEVPDEFSLGQHYPNRDETDTCRPIRLRITRNSRLYRNNLVVNSNPGINFLTSDTRLMTPRLQTRLNTLAVLYKEETGLKFTVIQAWSEYSEDDGINDPNSLHYEGRSVRVNLRRSRISLLLKLAVQAGFDWVIYAATGYVRLSVIPDVCDVNVDLVFMLDQSGSVGPMNHGIALQFMQDVVSFFSISANSTQVGLVTYSSGAAVEFNLNDFNNLHSLLNALNQIQYTGGWTNTAWALLLATLMLDSTRGYGARPSSQGIPKVAVLITDGRSNLYRIDEAAPLLRNSGVQVYTVGIGDIYLPELQFIASDPDNLHVFLLNSFSDAPNFVDFLSFTACDTPAIVEPGDNTTTEVEEDGFRFFQSECAAFSQTVMIEQVDLVGSCSLYASTQVQNPGPLNSNDLVVRNENQQTRRRSVVLSFLHQSFHRFVYWSVRGHYIHNTFSVIIWDMIFQEDYYTVYVPEGVSGRVIFDLNGELRTTNVTFNYTITEGNEGGLFEIGLQNGLLSVVSPLNANQYDYILLTIVAQNSQFSCHRGRVNIKIIVIRDDIEFPDTPPVPIPENSPTDTPVTQITATGADGSIEYSITGGNVGGAFQIDPDTGSITVASQLDFESQDTYSLTIQAESVATGRTGSVVQIINILDVNEAPFFTNPCASSGSCVFSVNENQPLNTIVDVLTASDPDLPATLNGMLEFSIIGSAPFILQGVDRQAELKTTEEFDREMRDSYDFSVRVADRGIPSLFSELTVTVTITDVNDNAPVFVQPPIIEFVLESTAVTTLVTQFLATDDDIGSNQEIIFSISSNLGPLPFEIDSSNGSLVVSEVLDFEATNFYAINVTASNPDGLQRTTVMTSIVIQDVNDNPPVFSQEEYNGTIVENSLDGAVILTVVATDRDFGSNAMIEFSIVSGNTDNLIAINPASPNIGVVQMSVMGNIDREQIQLFDLVIRANDLGTPQMEDFARVLITVLDINDHPPTFLPPFYSASLREDASPMDVLEVFAFDLDQPQTVNSELTFAITRGNTGNVFALNQSGSSTAALRLIGELNFELVPQYELELIAMDQGDPQMNGTAIVVVTVTDVNEIPPVVGGNQTIEVSESTALNVIIATISASDNDSAVIMFTITSVQGVGVNGDIAMGVFDINNDGSVSLVQELDFETSPSYVITIEVSDGQLTTTTTLTVNVLDENELPPIFNDNTAFTVLEEQPAGTIVGTVQATDGDGTSTLTYQIVSGEISSLFDIDEEMGVITTSQVLDREQLVQKFDPSRGSTGVLKIHASDGTFFTFADISITLEDINDNTPVFEQISNGFLASVMENRPSGEPVFNGVAMDLDIGSNGEVTYSIEVSDLPSGVDIPFIVDPSTGRVTTSLILDREERSEYTVVVTARDNGASSLSTSASVTVTVLDDNDNAPVFSQPQYEVTIPENTPAPVDVTQVSASDIDEGPNGAVSYSIQMTNPSSSAALFSINSTSGEITLTSPLNFEATPLHTLTVLARDSGAPSQSDTAQVLVNVGNVDEVPPRFDGPCTQSIEESIEPNNPIMQCVAIDIDDVTNSTTGAVTYEILSGNIDDTFTIANDGTISVVRRVDRETIDFYSILIQATDSVGLNDTTLLNVTITDVNDNMPQFANIPATRTITLEEIQSHEINFFTVEATDADIGSNAELEYSITQVTRLVNGIDTELEITVTDRGSSALSNTATVTFMFEPLCTLQDYSVDSTDGRIFSRFLCSVIVEPPRVDITLGNDLQLSCNILRNTEATFEWIHNGTSISGPTTLPPSQQAGELTVEGVIFQDAGNYACRVMTDVGSLQSSNAVVGILVPPVITIAPQDTAAELGRSHQFNCFATGVPDPTIEWTRPLVGGGSTIITETDRIFVRANFLIIFGLESGDQGTYTCNAVNPAGTASASAMISIFGLSNVVNVEVVEFSNANMENTCHELNNTEFETVMTDITSTNTMVTNANGENLCNQTACSPSPCGNGGSCELQLGDIETYVCTCAMGYTGVNCENDINECGNNPCLFGGTCTNTDGSFVCTCLPDYTGDQCQYSTVCETQAPCPDNQSCVATVTNNLGYVCSVVNEDEAVTVSTGGGDMTPGALDNQVNNLQEMQSTASDQQKRRRRQAIENTGFVSTCEARFLQSSRNPGNYVLVWACPVGLEPPSDEELDEICRELFASGVVTSCSSPTGVSFEQTPTEPLPSTTLSISFILVDENGEPLSGLEVLEILQETQALDRLREQGYQATNFTAAVPPLEPAPVEGAPTGLIVGVIVAVLLAAALCGLVFLVVCLVKHRRSRNKKTTKEIGSRQQLPSNLHQTESPSQENLFENPYTYLSSPDKRESDDQFSFAPPATVHHPIETSPVHHDNRDSPKPSKEVLFDNPIYSSGYIPPSATQSPRQVHSRSPVTTPSKDSSLMAKRRSLERAASLVRERISNSFKIKRGVSEHKLLKDNSSSDDDDDYDEVIPSPKHLSVPHTPPHTRSTPRQQADQSSQFEDDEIIYGNLDHSKLGAKGNAGERWESYWKTNTLLRSPQHEEEKTDDD